MSPEIPVPTYRYWGERKPPENKSDIFRVTAAAGPREKGAASEVKTEKVATLRMYGPIDSMGGLWGISANEVSEALDSLGEVDRIVVRLNSPGGDAWEGMAISNMLRSHSAHVTTVVDGIAASAASYIASSADETVMSPGTQMMIHDASALAFGPADAMDQAKALLDSISNSIASLYVEAAGGSTASWRAKMKATTWYTADEAVEAKLADRIGVVADIGAPATAGDATPTSSPEDRFDLSMYGDHKHPTASADGNTHTEGGSAVELTPEQITMRQKLGIAEDADEATTLAALDEALAERAEPQPEATSVPEGHVVIPAAKLADLEAGAALASATAKSLAEKERDAFLDGPEARGKYLPANREAWAKEYDRDPVATKAHFAEAPVLVPTSEIGHDNPVAEAVAEDDRAYYELFPGDKIGA